MISNGISLPVRPHRRDTHQIWSVLLSAAFRFEAIFLTAKMNFCRKGVKIAFEVFEHNRILSSSTTENILYPTNKVGYAPQVANRCPRSIVVTDIRTDGRTDGQTNRLIESLVRD